MNKIIGTLAYLCVKLGNITQALEKDLFQVVQFVQATRKTVWQGNSYVEHVQLQLNMLLLGHLSPSVITPRSLKGLQLEIEIHYQII